jgi:chitinase
VVVEGNSGTADALIVLSMAAAADGPVTVNWSTADGGAKSGSDYVASSGTATFEPGGPLNQTIAVPIIGDRLFEFYEDFYIDLENGFRGYVQIVDDEPRISISNYVGVDEGDTGTADAVFVVSLLQPYDQPVSVEYTTTEGGDDFQTQSGTLTIAPGQTAANITVAVYGDTIYEDTEYFAVDLSNPSANAVISSGHGLGIIIDDDVYEPPSIRISDASLVEGDSGTTLMAFTVTLSAAGERDVWVDFSTSNGTAKTSDKDYLATSGTLYFPAGETMMTIYVVINGDKKKEKNESFNVNLFNAVDALFADAKGVGTILNDDTR